jgi:poly-gamma-glutamate capsule biosynthesis protein CapA/YwtB (metallophosphatase superfamily)
VERVVTVFLCGDVMTGRGVDQILPHPGDPALRERYVDDARTYVALAESVNGGIPRPVGFAWPWGDSLQVLDDVAPDVRVINLETSITRSCEFAPYKGVHYRMSPDNISCLAELQPSACALANNHVLDFGRTGLLDTLDALSRAGPGSSRSVPDVTHRAHGNPPQYRLPVAGVSSSCPAGWRPAACPPAGLRPRAGLASMRCLP